jgi:hypothetical protein
VNVLWSWELFEGNVAFRAGSNGSLFEDIASECNLFAYLKKN